ncbi:MAG: universal stress protein [Betaproteobacteria bacterium]|nr:universal stress protein [Betaproteobacteria bacterium]
MNPPVRPEADDSVPNILVPVQPDRDVRWCAQFLAGLHRDGRIRVHLLSVQPPYDGLVRMFFNRESVDEFQAADARRELQPLRDALDALGVPYNTHMAVGQPAEEIARFAREYHCPRIVFGPWRGGVLPGLVFGSLPRQVELLMRHAGGLCEVV